MALMFPVDFFDGEITKCRNCIQISPSELLFILYRSRTNSYTEPEGYNCSAN